MQEWSVDDWTKIITAAVALVAVVVSPLLQWRIARRQLLDGISSKRQIWIDALRQDSAEFLQVLARIEELKRPSQHISLEDQKLVFDEMSVVTARANELGIRIKLRLNPNEDAHNMLVVLFEDLMKSSDGLNSSQTSESVNSEIREFSSRRNKVISQLQVILKSEWERVKRGE